MYHLKNFQKFNEALGVAEATLPYVDILTEFIINETLSFCEDTIEEPEIETVEDFIWKYDVLKEVLPKKSIYSWFPVSRIDLNLKLCKDDQDYEYLVGGYASQFGKKKEKDVSKFKKGVKKNADHSISINLGIEVYLGVKFKRDDEKQIDILTTKIKSVVLHELNHLYEYYQRTWDPYNREVKLSVTWASIGDIPKDIDKKVFEYWQNNFLTHMYESEPHEVRAQIQEAKAYVDK